VTPGGARAGASPAPIHALLAHDLALGERFVAGADEAGRGCLAGPIVAAAVCLDLQRLGDDAVGDLARLDDSKRLTARRRAVLAGAVMRHAAQVVVVTAQARTIDADGLHATNVRIMRDALARLDPAPGIALVDGFDLGPGALAHRRVVKGDATSAAIAAASVIAKEARDRLMRGPAASAYPGYGFEGHVGYITAAHTHAVLNLGPSPLHRRSFRARAYGGDLTLFE
jgi:ribonuclease HII